MRLKSLIRKMKGEGRKKGIQLTKRLENGVQHKE